LEYAKLAPEGIALMTALGHYLNTETGLEPVLLDLVRLLASLLNGCEYCIHLHTAELKKLNEPEERIAGLRDWRGSSAYTQRERAAFAWTEAVTNIQDGHTPDAFYAQVREHFSELETVNLTLAITTINAWNRLEISLGSFRRMRAGPLRVERWLPPSVLQLSDVERWLAYSFASGVPRMSKITLNINGIRMPVNAPGDETLLSVLRNRLNLTGTKYGCGEGECGACTVLLDGHAIKSCQTLVSDAVGAKITTIEGLEQHGQLTPVQQAFLDEDAFQCGYCTSGMIMRATALLQDLPNPSEAQIVTRMNGNICRCGTYPRIVVAVQRASHSIAKGGAR